MSQEAEKGLPRRGRAPQHVPFCDRIGRARRKQSEHSATPPRVVRPWFFVPDFLSLLAMDSAAIAVTCYASGYFASFMALPLDFVSIASDTLLNTLAAPLADRALSSLDDVHQGRVIFFHSSYLRLANEEKPL